MRILNKSFVNSKDAEQVFSMTGDIINSKIAKTFHIAKVGLSFYIRIMRLGLPVFMLFAIYGIVNTFLPILLRLKSYSATNIGLLLSIFEISGIVFPFLLSTKLENSKSKYRFLLFCAFIMSITIFPLIIFENFYLSLVCLSLFAIGFKGAVPASDTMINLSLAKNPSQYGTIRVFGSVGFVFMTLIMQLFLNAQTVSKNQLCIWFFVPIFLFFLSLFVFPKELKTGSIHQTQIAKIESEKAGEKIENGKKKIFNFSPFFIAVIFLLFSTFFALTPATKLFSLYVTEFLHLNCASALWAISATTEIPFMFFSGKFLKRFGCVKLIIFCAIIASVRLLIYILIPNLAGAIIGQSLNAITYGLLHPAAVLFAFKYAPPNAKTLANAMYSIFAIGLASILGNAIGGFVIDKFGYKTLFLSFGFIPIFALIVFAFFYKKIKTN